MIDQTASSGFFGSSGKKKRTSFLSCLTNLNAFAREPTSFAIRFSSSSNTSHNRFAKISGRMNSLYLGASFAPRMEHAASQIQDSSDLSGGSGIGMRVAERAAVGKMEFVRESTPDTSPRPSPQ